MSEHFEKFNNGDLGLRYVKYLNGKVKMKQKHLKVTQLDEDEYALDIYTGDEKPLIDYDTYLYDNEQEAVEDALELYVIYLRYRLKLRYSWKLMSGGGIFYVDEMGMIIKKESYYGNELDKLYPNAKQFCVGEFISWAEENLSEELKDKIIESGEIDACLFSWYDDVKIQEADEGFRKDYVEKFDKAS